MSFLKARIRDLTREDIKFSVDSLGNSGNESQQIELQKKYLDFYFTNVFYFPKNTPEELIWSDSFSELMAKAILPESKFNDYQSEIISATSFKEKFSIYTKFTAGKYSSEDILSTQKLFIQKWINDKDQSFHDISSTINAIR